MTRFFLAFLLVLAAGLMLAPAAPAANFERDWSAFCAEVDQTWPFFDLKGVREDWNAAKERLAPRVSACKSDAVFLGLVMEAIQSLRDMHMGLRDTRVPLPVPPPQYYPGLSFMPVSGNQVMVFALANRYRGALPPGTVILRIDDEVAGACLEKMVAEEWARGHCSSMQFARLMAWRIPLRGEKGATHTLTFMEGAREKTLTVTCDMEAQGWPHSYNPPPNLIRTTDSLAFTKLGDGNGYVQLRVVEAQTVPGLKQALARFPEARGWIVDLRGATGGVYDAALLEQAKSMPKPLAVLMDAGCMAAAETLARDLAQEAGGKLIGAPTAGACSTRRFWKFPSGVATVAFPGQSHPRADGKPIEYNGITPEMAVETLLEEVRAGKNSEILRAQEYLRAQGP